MRTVRHLAERARAAGAEIAEGVEVTGFELGEAGVEAVRPRAGRIAARSPSLAPGPWAADRTCSAGRRVEVASTARDAAARRLLEGTGGRVRAPRAGAGASRGPRAARRPPRPGRRRCAPTVTTRCSSTGPWGIYFRIGRERRVGHRRRAAGAARGSRPRPVRPRQPRARRRAGVRGLLHLGPRRGDRALPRARRRTGGRRSPAGSSPTPPTTIRSATGWLPNAYAIVDSGHGFKLLALGRLAADEFLGGEPRLEPFRLSRFARGETHTASQGPYPWT